MPLSSRRLFATPGRPPPPPASPPPCCALRPPPPWTCPVRASCPPALAPPPALVGPPAAAPPPCPGAEPIRPAAVARELSLIPYLAYSAWRSLSVISGLNRSAPLGTLTTSLAHATGIET